MEDSFKEIVKYIRHLFNNFDGVIPLHVPVFIGKEKEFLNECIDSTFVSSIGVFVDKFEEKMAEYTGATKAVACVNGTSALHLALKMLGVMSNDEVITQPLTFVATANAIAYCGASPVFLDVDIDTLGLSPDSLKIWLNNSTFQQMNKSTHQPETINKTTGRRISACIPMHTFGHPCRIDEILEICSRYHIAVIEDATESLGSFYKGKHTGTFAKIGVISFNGNKIITTGGGGMLLFQDEKMAKHAKYLTTQAKVSHPWEIFHDEIGYNLRMPNINAAIGLAQLENLPYFLKLKREIADKYAGYFSKTNITCIKEPKNSRSNYWLNSILLKNKSERDSFLSFTHDNGIMTRPAWQLMNTLPMYSHCQKDNLKTASAISERLVNIPSSAIICN